MQAISEVNYALPPRFMGRFLRHHLLRARAGGGHNDNALNLTHGSNANTSSCVCNSN
jgi:hypothetical protein